jgi:hypothetical protein
MKKRRALIASIMAHSMPNLIKHFYVTLIIAIGQASMLVALLALYPAVLTSGYLDPDLIWIRTITLAIGVILMSIILVRFIAKYRKSPSRARLNVLLGLLAFMISLTSYLLASSIVFPASPGASLLDSFIHDVSRIFLFVATYLFVIFGTTFLLGSEEKQADKFRHVLDVLFLVIYATYIITEISDIAGITGEIITDLQGLGQIFLIFFGLFSLVLLITIAARAASLAKHTSDATYKSGLKALAISYVLLFSAIMTLFLNGVIPALDENKYIIVLGIGLLVVGFYFIYAGFVKPSTKGDSK